MNEVQGKLDGLRDIIAPLMPVQQYQLPWFLLLTCLLLMLLLLMAYRSYRRRPLVRARRSYRRLAGTATQLDAHRLGDALSSILRTYCGCHNLREADVSAPDRQLWLVLLDDCNELRFAGVTCRNEVIERAMQSTRKLLWPSQ